MEIDKEIKIVADDGDKITYQIINTDDVIRKEIADIKIAIESLEKEVAEKNAKIEELKEKVAFAEEIIALADAQKASSDELNYAENTEATVVEAV